VTLFHDARACQQPDSASDEDRLGVAVAEGFKTAQPTSKDGCDAVKREFRVNLKHVLWLARDEVLLGVEAKAAAELGKGSGGHGEADGEGMATEARE
jgi:hypothetical protein